MSKTTKDELGLFISIVQEGFQKLLRRHKIALCLIFLGTFVIGFSLAVALESLFYLSASVKISTALGVMLISAGAAFYFFRKSVLPSFKEFYHGLGKQHASPQLSDALDLHFDSNQQNPSLHRAAIHQNIGSLSKKEIKQRVNSFTDSHKINKRYQSSLLGCFAGLVLLATFIFAQPEAVNRITHLWASYSAPNPYSYTIEPGTLTLEHGKPFTPEISFEGETPQTLSLAFKTDIEEEFRRRSAASTENSRAEFAPISFTTDGSYYFIMDGFKSAAYRINIQLRPRFEQLKVQVVPPAYTRLDTASYVYPFPQITAYRGSEILLEAAVNKPVSQILLYRTALGDSVALSSVAENPVNFTYRWKAEAVDTVSFNMTDSAGLSNKNKFQFIVEPSDDQRPFVNLIEPSGNMRMKTPENLRVRYEAGDDFGLTEASLHFELQRAFTEKPQHGAISLPRPAMNQTESYTWELPGLDPKPRDVVTFWIEVKDNDAYSGAKTGRSQKLTISFPSMTEYLDELEAKEDDVAESLENISDSFNQMQQEYDRFKEQLKQNPESSWKQEQGLEQIKEQQQKVDKQLENLNQKFKEIREEVEKNRVMSPETMEAYKKLQQLMKEINNPELAKALEEIRKSLGSMSPSQMRKALENYEFNEELYKERIQRTMELFKSLKLNSGLEKMAVALERLAEQEQKISESEQANGESLEQQKAVQKDFQEVQKQLNELTENAPDKAKKKVGELQQNAERKLDQINRELQENIKQLKQQKSSSKKSPKIQKQQQNIQKQMQQMAGQMRDAKQQLNRQQRKINTAALKYVLYSLINLSQNQEKLTKETESLPSRSQAFVEKAREERNISQQFSMLSDSLFQISSEIPNFSNRINKKKIEVEDKLSNAVEMLAERDKSNSVLSQRQSLGGINELSSMIASLLDQLQNQQGGGSGGGMSMQQFIEQMQKMSGQQQKLNQQIQNMINDMQGNRLTRDQMERLNQLSRQQNAIRKQLQELQRKGGLETGDEVLSELERMSEEMEDAINDLRGGQLNRQFVRRQQNILSRMLNAEQAVQERGKEERREATSAQDSPQSTPPDVTLEELQQQIRKSANDPNRTKFREDYQRLIEQYFELLKELKQGDGQN